MGQEEVNVGPKSSSFFLFIYLLCIGLGWALGFFLGGGG